MSTTYKLVALENDDEFELNLHNMSIGRDKNADIVLRHGYPSRHHAKLTISNDQLIIEDLNSTNGTYVNNCKLNRPQVLQEGDVVQFDSLAYHVVPAAKPDRTVMSKNLKPINAREEESSVVIISSLANNADTAIRETYVLPQSWSLQDNNKIKGPAPAHHYPDTVIDKIIADKTKDLQPLAAVLVIISGKQEGRLIGLNLSSEEQLWNIGRATNGAIQLDDASVSSRHACIFYNNGRWGITDEDSRNGSKVKGLRISETPLTNNDLIELGQVYMVFRLL